jgi:hypothetical protein
MLIPDSSVKSLKWKYAKALLAMRQSLDVFQELNQSVDTNTCKKWEAQEDIAMKFQGDYLSVYNVKSEKGEFLLPSSIQR